MDFKNSIKAKLSQRKANKKKYCYPEPVYDEVYCEGIERLNSIGGKDLRPCEQVYNFQGMTFTPDYINELASSNNLLWLLRDMKHHEGVVLTVDEVYQLIEAVYDNWKRYHEST